MEKVLIVDDSKFSRELITNFVKALNYEVIGEAVDGLDGIEKCKLLSPDIIISDIEMPKLNGIEMIEEIRTFNKDVKIVVVTSVVNSQVLQRVLRLKASIVKKPIKEQLLVNAINLLD